MIVRVGQDGLLLVTQPDHARLAGRIMAQCVALDAHPRRESILRAAADHDNGWIDVDAAPTIDSTSGRVVDFISAPVAVRQGVWPIAIAGLDDDPWAAALVAQHAITAYDRFRPDGAWATFFDDMEAVRDAMLARRGLAFDALAADYPFVRLGDLISLAFCTCASDALQFAGWTIQRSGSRVVVTPDPFGGVNVPIDVTARSLGAHSFRTDADLRHALREASTTILHGQVAGAARPA